MKSRSFNAMVISMTVLGLVVFGGVMIYRDPFFCYHKPIGNDEKIIMKYEYAPYYIDGFIEYFDYDAIITGTSMCHNFKTSLVQELFGVDKAVKFSISGSYFSETNGYLQEAFECNPDIKLVVRSLDCDGLGREKDAVSGCDAMADYLRDDNIFNDVNYVLNKKVMLESNGMTEINWDDWLSWRNPATGESAFHISGDSYAGAVPEQKKMDEESCRKTSENIEENIVRIMKENPDTEFYLFFTPYSIFSWGNLLYRGDLEIQIQEQKIAIEQILQCENAHLFSFCNMFDIICDRNNYGPDIIHYAPWVNDEILNSMHEGRYQLTLENYHEYLDEITAFYTTYPYHSL